ncbi:hypothetical protein EDEG_03957 [Edhazardia aedis USNM 41457]|uniref:polynucleotide adenylyltransferase n=1 Tax=Edhazardia aedis (strain USNM 41457) TaxID=1003232 RepID=J9D1H1_EDHAE|nr:hypothetical protein EDEG_03957 [Edhazardia aedis USNM 41457]|eukprot:EJW01424.1 hypothetical protein EDEG_03957 [Edhazardia aedis USNM 41457]
MRSQKYKYYEQKKTYEKYESTHSTKFLSDLEKPFSKPNMQKLNFELFKFSAKIAPTPRESEIREILITKMRNFLVDILGKKYGKSFSIIPFGSTESGLILPTSDIDLAICEDTSVDKDKDESKDVKLEVDQSNKKLKSIFLRKKNVERDGLIDSIIIKELSLIGTENEHSKKRKIADENFEEENFSNSISRDSSMSSAAKKFILRQRQRFGNFENQESDTKNLTSTAILSFVTTALRNANFIDKKQIIYIKNARVPIIKCRDNYFGIEYDIAFNQKNASQHSAFIKSHLQSKPYLKPLCLIMKYFLKTRNLHDSRYGGLCSYAQFLMILNFCMLHPILQCKRIDPLKNLGVIMLDMFQYYGLDYPYDGVTIDNNRIKYVKQQMGSAIISIQDPIDENHDVGDNCSTMYTIKEVFQHAYKIMLNTLRGEIDPNKSILSLWFCEDFHLNSWRRSLAHKCSTAKTEKIIK